MIQREHSDKMGYAQRGVGGEEGCYLQIIADRDCSTADDVAVLRARDRDDLSINTVKVRLQKSRTISQTIELCAAARRAGYKLIVSSEEDAPETTDTFITDLAVAMGASQLAAGGVIGAEYSCKFARLMEIFREDRSIPFVGKEFRMGST